MKITWYWLDKGPTADRMLEGSFYFTQTMAHRLPEYATVRDRRRSYNVCRVDFDTEEDADLDWRAFMQTMVLAAELQYAERYGK